jgi:hypothetical protein
VNKNGANSSFFFFSGAIAFLIKLESIGDWAFATFLEIHPHHSKFDIRCFEYFANDPAGNTKKMEQTKFTIQIFLKKDSLKQHTISICRNVRIKMNRCSHTETENGELHSCVTVACVVRFAGGVILRSSRLSPEAFPLPRGTQHFAHWAEFLQTPSSPRLLSFNKLSRQSSDICSARR